MSKGVKGVYIAIWVLLVISTFFQFLGIAGTTDLFGIYGHATEINFLSLWVLSTLLLPVAAVLCGIFSKKEKWPFLPMVIAIVGAALALIVVFSMGTVEDYQESFNQMAFSGNRGLTPFRILYRHGLPVLVGVMLAVVSYLNHKNAQDDRIRKEEEAYKEHYLLNGEPLFKDAEGSTLGLNEYAEDFSVGQKKRKLKKSQRVAKEKLLKRKANEKKS